MSAKDESPEHLEAGEVIEAGEVLNFGAIIDPGAIVRPGAMMLDEHGAPRPIPPQNCPEAEA